MPGLSAKCLQAQGTTGELGSITGVTGTANISNVCHGPDGRLWATVENYPVGSGVPPVVAIPRDGSTPSSYTVTGSAATNNFGGICTDGTYIYAADSTGVKLFKLDTSGNVVANTGTALGTAGVGAAGLAGVQYLGGKIWFADNAGNGHIGVINTDLSTGLTLYTPPSNGGAHGLNIGMDGNGNQVLWFCEANNSQTKVAYCTTAGAITEITVPNAPYYAAMGSDGNVYFTMRTAGKIGQIILPSQQVKTWNSGSGTTAQPGGLNPDYKGNIWVCEENTTFSTVYAFSQLTLSTTVSPIASPTAAGQPDKIVVGPNSVMYFTEHNAGRIGWVQS